MQIYLKRSSPMVLTDINGCTICKAISSVCSIYVNMKLNFSSSCIFGNAAGIFSAFSFLVGLSSFSFALHLCLVNLLTDSLPKYVIALEPSWWKLLKESQEKEQTQYTSEILNRHFH